MEHPRDKFPAFVDTIDERVTAGLPLGGLGQTPERRPRRRRRGRGRVRRFFRLLFWGAFLFLFGEPIWKLATTRPAWVFEPDVQALLLDRSGDGFLSWPEYGDRRPVEFADLPDDMVKAVLAREDQRFFSHPGVDAKALVRAAIVDFQSRRIEQGGSTITMQLVERVYGYPQDTPMDQFRAKVFETMMAPRLEWYAFRKFGSQEKGKQALLASYLSRVEYGHQTVGLREAAHCYFGKSVSNLTLGESAYLAGLIRGPSVNNAYRNPDNARQARDAVIANMEKLKWVNPARADQVSFYVSSKPHRKHRQGDGFLSAAVKRELDELVAMGDIPADYLSRGRLRISLSSDPEIQDLVRNSLVNHLRRLEAKRGFKGAKGSLQGAVVVIDNDTGSVLASIGGRDFEDLSFDCAMQGRRTVASAGKPFLFASLMKSRRMRATDEVSNASLREFESPEVKGIRSPRETRALPEGMHPLWKGLAYSSNRMSMRVGDAAGFVSWTRLLRDVGLVEATPAMHTSSWLGSYGVKPVDLAAAYAVFPRGGYYNKPYLVRRVEIEGRTVYRRWIRSKRVLPTKVCNEVTASLREVLRQGTAAAHGGKAFAKQYPVAGKTGTSDGVGDLWFAGYSSDVTTVVWIGFPEGNRTVIQGETGGSLAFPLWKTIMEGLPERYEFQGLPELDQEERIVAVR